MKINNLINRNYTTTSVLEDLYEVSEWLKEFSYIAIMDEELKTIGIITLKDLQSVSHGIVLDCNFIKPHVKPDQTIFEVFHIMKETEKNFLPVFERNEFIGVISLLSITERLTQLMDEKQQGYQKVIHDLRNPILNFQGLLNILNISLTDYENQDLIQLCNLSCKHAIDILDDFLFVELEESKILHKIPLEVNSFYKQCINEQLGLCLLKNIEVVIDFCPDEIIKDIDKNQFKRAIQNVFSNAVKFSYPKSTIKVSSEMDNGNLTLKIVDAGIGIPIRLQPEIFKKFTIAQRGGTNGEASTGLGLFFSKQCIEQHNGSIYFKSEENKGTKFYICI